MSKRIDDLIAQGKRLFDQGNYQKAIPRFEEAIALARRQGDEGNELLALENMSVCWSNLGNYQQALDAATRLLARTRILQRKSYEMRAMLRLSEAIACLSLRERWPELKALLLEGLVLARNLREAYYECYFLIELGAGAVAVKEYEMGFRYLQEALNAMQPDMWNLYFCYFAVYCIFSKLMRKKEQYDEAIRYAELAIRSAQKRGNPNYIAESHLSLARAELARGERAEALRLIEQVLPQLCEHGWKANEQQAFYLRGEAKRELGHFQEAEEATRRALNLAQEMKIREEEVECLLSLGKVLVALKRREEARDLLTLVRRLSQERNYDDHFQAAEALLQAIDNKKDKKSNE